MPKPTGDSRAIKTYAKLDNERRALEDKLKKVKAKIEAAEPRVMDFFQKMGLDRLTVSGVTVYVQRQLWAGREDDVTHEQAAAALKKAKLGEYAAPRVNTQSLSAYLRELDEAGTEMPKALKGIIKVSEVFKVRTRKG